MVVALDNPVCQISFPFAMGICIDLNDIITLLANTLWALIAVYQYIEKVIDKTYNNLH